MTAVEIKKSIHLSVESVNDTRLLEVINTMLLESLDPQVIAYEGNKPLRKADLIMGALQAEEDIKQGRFFTIEEVKHRLKSDHKE